MSDKIWACTILSWTKNQFSIPPSNVWPNAALLIFSFVLLIFDHISELNYCAEISRFSSFCRTPVFLKEFPRTIMQASPYQGYQSISFGFDAHLQYLGRGIEVNTWVITSPFFEVGMIFNPKHFLKNYSSQNYIYGRRNK